MKKLFIGLASLSTISTTTFLAVACGPKTITQQKETKTFRSFNLEAYQEHQHLNAQDYQINKSVSDIIDFNNQADINLYWNSWGSITYDYMLKLALHSLVNEGTNRSTREVHFAYCPEAPGLNHQSLLNAKYLETLLKTRNANSSVINMHDDISGNVIEEWKKIIEANPNKKINVWWNSDHVGRGHLNGSQGVKILDLAGYKNVNLQLIEDGASIGHVQEYLDDNELLSHFKNQSDVEQFDSRTQYYAQNLFTNVYSWFSSKVFDKYKNQNGFERIKTFEAKEISDKLFDSRINISDADVKVLTSIEGKASTLAIGDQRLFRAWPLVSGLDWRNSLKTLQDSQVTRPGLKSLLLLGTYGVNWEDEYIRSVWDRYHNQYNIFYKGHPGHNEHSDFVQNTLIDTEKKEGMFLLQSAIPSEELTRDHFLEGMKFDAVICLGQTSAMGGFPKVFNNPDGTTTPGYDLHTQFLEMAQPSGPQNTMEIIGNPTNSLYTTEPTKTAGWAGIESWLKTSGWL